MKYSININQVGIIRAGLDKDTDVIDWIIIDYLKDLFLLGENTIVNPEDGKHYVLINYSHLIDSLPIIGINNKNSLTNRFKKLRELNLIKTINYDDNTMYFLLTELCISTYYYKADISSNINNPLSNHDWIACQIEIGQPLSNHDWIAPNFEYISTIGDDINNKNNLLLSKINNKKINFKKINNKYIVPIKSKLDSPLSEDSTLPSENKKFDETSIEMQLANLLLEHILERKPNFKRPNLQTWAKKIDLMIRVDGRDPDRIKEVIEWCQTDDFWQNNILSTEKLRKHFDRLELQMEKNRRGNYGEDIIDKRIKEFERRYLQKYKNRASA